MKITIVGHKGYVGQNIKNALTTNGFDNLYLIDRETNEKLKEKLIYNSDVVIHCAGIQRSNDDELFTNNLSLTKSLIDNLSPEGKIIFISTIHYKSNTAFGRVRKMEEDYIIKNAKFFTIYHLPYTFGPFGLPDYNNVFNTFIFNVAKSRALTIKDFETKYPLISILSFCDDIVKNINLNIGVVNDFNILPITLPEFLLFILNAKNSFIAMNPLHCDLRKVYYWYHAS